jgi:type I restriction enzyme S subunit
MSRWPKVVLGELLRRSDEVAVLDLDAEYHEVTIKLWGKGVISRGKVRGSDVSTMRRVVHTNQQRRLEHLYVNTACPVLNAYSI